MLKLGPKERGKSRQNARKDQKVVRVMMRQKVTLYSVNANRLRNKMMSIQDTSYNRNHNIVYITEAGLGTHAAPEMKGFQPFKNDNKNPNRGSVMSTQKGS